MTYYELLKKANTPKIKIFAYVRITGNDGTIIECKKGDFIAQISETIAAGNGDLETNAMDYHGNILVG